MMIVLQPGGIGNCELYAHWRQTEGWAIARGQLGARATDGGARPRDGG